MYIILLYVRFSFPMKRQQQYVTHLTPANFIRIRCINCTKYSAHCTNVWNISNFTSIQGDVRYAPCVRTIYYRHRCVAPPTISSPLPSLCRYNGL